MKIGLLAVTLSFLATSAAAGDRCTAPDLQASVAEIVWQTGGVGVVQVDGDSVFVAEPHSLSKMSAASGEKRWTYSLPDSEEHDAYWTPHFVVLPDRVAIAPDGRYVVFLDRETGDPRARTDAGEWIRFLTGPPLLAVTQATNAAASTLVRMSPDGLVLGSRVVPRVSDVFTAGDVAAVELDQDDAGLNTITGYDLATLQPLWSEKSHTFNKQMVGDRLYLGDIFWSQGAKVIDPRTGNVTAFVPERDPYPMGGSGELDLQVVVSTWTGAWSPDFATCEILRRNDARTARTMWRTSLPFHVSATLRDGPDLYVAGSRDAEHRYLVVLDWKTGEVKRAWSGAPKLSSLWKTGDLVLGYDLWRDLVAIRVRER